MKIWLPLLFLFVAGCATSAKQTDAVLRTPPNVARSSEIKDVPFYQQADGHCGPATLAMAMEWAGKEITPEELAPKVLTPGRKGSLQMDLISAARREGMLAVPVTGLASLLREIDGGHPAIVFENLGLSWAPVWHYAIVSGYDLDKQEVIMHSGAEASKRVGLRRFESAWAGGDYWALVVLPAGRLSVSAGELSQMQAAAGLEKAGKSFEAQAAYVAILKRWPHSLGAMIGLGNLAYKKRDYKAAARILRRAVELHPESAIARNNLEVATSEIH